MEVLGSVCKGQLTIDQSRKKLSPLRPTAPLFLSYFNIQTLTAAHSQEEKQNIFITYVSDMSLEDKVSL